MKKNGFTLIEIIICISLISIISTGITISVIKLNQIKEKNVLVKNSSNLQNALEVYLSNHKEIVDNVKNNFKAGIISLEVLKNDGLIKDDLKKVNYKKEYYLLSNASLLSNGSSSPDCSSNQISINYFSSWDLSSQDSKVLYICPTDSGTSSSVTLNDVKLENYIPKGLNPNNYVINEYNGTTYNYRILEINEENVFLLGSSDIHKNNTNLSSFIKENSVVESDYYKEYHSVGATSMPLDVNEIQITKGKIGFLTYSEFMKTFDIDGSYILDIHFNLSSSSSKYIFLNSLTDNFTYGKNGIYVAWKQNGFKLAYYKNDPANTIKLPILKLNNSCASLKEKNDCGDNKFGSENCPYILDDSAC